MAAIDAERYYAEIEAQSAALAALVDGGDLSLPIPTCPDWTLRQLCTHVGRAHRWAAEITATRAAEPIAFRSVPDGKFPGDPAQQPAWLRAGAQRLVQAVRRPAAADPVWAFGTQRPAIFWARRMTHETLVHRADADLAAGRQAQIAPDLAADAIDEWLGLRTGPLAGDEPGQALPQGRSLHLHATGQELAGAAEWLVSHEPAGLTVRTGHAEADVTLTGPAGPLLLVLLGRLRPADDPAVSVLGDASLLDQWLAHTPF